MLRRIYSQLSEHQFFLLLLLVFITFRLLSIIVLQPGGLVVAGGPDPEYYFDIGRLAGSGQLPFINFWMEYPPLMPWLAVLAYKLSLSIAPWVMPLFWFNLIFRLLILPFDIATLVLIYKIANLFYSRDKALLVAALWALFFAPLFTLLGWFDPIALFFLILGLYGLLAGRSLLSGAALGLGFMAKIVPIVIWPVGWLTLGSYRRRLIYFAGTLAVVGALAVPLLILAPQYLIASFRSLSSVSSWETVWALLEGYRGYGLVSPLATRNDPASALLSVHPSTLPWPVITAIFVLIYILVITRPIDWRDRSKIALGALFSFSLALLYNKGYSPQWATYLGTLALLALPLRRGTLYALLFSLFFIAEWPIAFLLFKTQNQILVGVIVLRTVVTICLCVEAASRLWAQTRIGYLLQRAMLPLSLALTISATVLAIPSVASAYMTSRVQAEPLAPWLQALPASPRSGEPIVLIQPELLERLSPYLAEGTLQLLPGVNGAAWVQPETWLTDTLLTHRYAWFMYDTALNTNTPALFRAADAWFKHSGCVADRQTYRSVQVKLYALVSIPPQQTINGHFREGLNLQTATLPTAGLMPGDVICLKESWQASTALLSDNAMFVHLQDADGQVAAQSDLQPPVPSSQWSTGYEFTLSHVFEVPSDLKSGTYTLVAGVYDLATGERLPLMDGGSTLRLAEFSIK